MEDFFVQECCVHGTDLENHGPASILCDDPLPIESNPYPDLTSNLSSCNVLAYQQSSLYFVFSYPFTSKFELAAKLHWVIRAASSTAPQYRHLTAAVHAAAPAPILGPRRTWFGFWRSGQTKTVLAIFSAVGSRATPRPGLAAGLGLALCEYWPLTDRRGGGGRCMADMQDMF